MQRITQTVFDDLFKGEYKDKTKAKNERNCNEVFYEYLNTFKDGVNDKYFILMTKFVILFRECYDKSKNKEMVEDDKNKIVGNLMPEGLPDSCNEFYGEFLEQNNFFGINENEKDEIIELIQHFCIWLFKNDYTKSKLSLASN